MWRGIWFIGLFLIMAAAGARAARGEEPVQTQSTPALTVVPQVDSQGTTQAPTHGSESPSASFNKGLHTRWYWYLEEGKTESSSTRSETYSE